MDLSRRFQPGRYHQPPPSECLLQFDCDTNFRCRELGLRAYPLAIGVGRGQDSETARREPRPTWLSGILPSYQSRELTHIRQTESITGTSTRTPTAVARAAGLVGPKSAIATATASSKKLLAPIKDPGVAMLCRTLNNRIKP